MSPRRPRTSLVLAAVLAATTLAACGQNTTTTTTSHEIASPMTSLQVTSGGGDITLVPTGGALRIIETATYTGRVPQGTPQVHDGAVTVTTSGCGGQHGACGISYRVEIPAGLTVRLASGGGAIDAQGNVENLDVRSGGGSATLRLSAPPRQVDVDSAGGQTTMELPAGPYAVTTNTGGGLLTTAIDTDPAAVRRVTVTTGGGDLAITRLKAA
ncbi:hypothetical protein JOD64_002715 [Micromonospora luteifusca]|uniref:Adhesin domain-containing protein n=1 Tax=Micromonospora luteifusca TaxID=709860 RepID=A0ABS2LTJ8_9ACTN|nr:hypothetical protein [Micromonospora luteifusca]MBM7491493.1 hypothetical protein [Micromonospora luteifusca]